MQLSEGMPAGAAIRIQVDYRHFDSFSLQVGARGEYLPSVMERYVAMPNKKTLYPP